MARSAPVPSSVRKSDTPGSVGVDLTLKAAGDAALGDFTAKITGQTASSGDDFSKEIKFTVSQ